MPKLLFLYADQGDQSAILEIFWLLNHENKLEAILTTSPYYLAKISLSSAFLLTWDKTAHLTQSKK